MKKFMVVESKRNTMKILRLFPVFLLLFAMGCEKEKVHAFLGEDRIQFAKTNSSKSAVYEENLGFSFAGKGAISEHEMIIPLVIAGRTASVDRQVAIEIVPEKTTAQEGIDYILEESFIPAESSQGYVKVKLLNTESLETETKTLTIRVVANDNFQVGLQKQLVSSISFYNYLVMPPNWSLVSRSFGDYSLVKHEFILFYLDIPSIAFTADPKKEDLENHLYSTTTVGYFRIQLRSILRDLNAGIIEPKENDPFTYPLKDEKGNEVIFP